MTKTTLILALIGLTLLTGSEEAPKVPVVSEVPVVQIKPLYDHLIMAPQNWRDAYGDTLEARLIYNMAVLRNNQMEIAKMISRMHPPIDPNAPTLESRIEALENGAIMDGDTIYEKSGNGLTVSHGLIIYKLDPNAPIDPNE